MQVNKGRNVYFSLCHSCHHYCRPRVVWPLCICDGTAYKRDRYPQSIGCFVQQLLLLVSKEFLLLVGIAFIISIPVTWWAMHAWLQDFAYRININIWVFAIAGLAVLLIALLTISFQAIKSSRANPVKSLRTE
jgi:hypothetical protein